MHPASAASIDVPIRRIWQWLLACILGCVALGFIGDAYREASASRLADGNLVAAVFKQFDLNDEANVPTWLSSSLFLLTGLLAGVMARVAVRREPREVLPWVAVALAFGYFSLDEAARVHEQTNRLLHLVVGTPRGVDVLSLTLVLLVGGALLPFTLRLDAPTRRAAILCAVLFVVGGAGIEVVTNKLLGLSSAQIRAALVITPLEELLEMLAALVFIRALLTRLSLAGPALQLRFVDTRRQPDAAD